MRRFYLNRLKDVSGVSGLGKVAEGCVMSNGTVVLLWLTKTPSMNIYKDITDLEAVHGHQNTTKILWIDN
jgi:hypothetical protein